MANIAGYKGALMGALELNRYVPMLTTAAGPILPAKYFVIGAGVAGLQAIATSRRIGAVRLGTDVRPEVKEQIESVGAKYVGIQLKGEAHRRRRLRQRTLRRRQGASSASCSPSSAPSPTSSSPPRSSAASLPQAHQRRDRRRMKPGSVIIDLAAEGGGNCELSKPGETVIENGVKIVAPLNLPSPPCPPTRACSGRATSRTSSLAFWKDKAFKLDLDRRDHARRDITHQGAIVHPWVKEAVASIPARRRDTMKLAPPKESARDDPVPIKRSRDSATVACWRRPRRDPGRPTRRRGGTPAHGGESLDYISMLFVFMLASFIGIGVIRRVSRLLHTPLMSLTNAISAIAVVGSIMIAGGEHYPTYPRSWAPSPCSPP
jgi:hypothetical protein